VGKISREVLKRGAGLRQFSEEIPVGGEEMHEALPEGVEAAPDRFGQPRPKSLLRIVGNGHNAVRVVLAHQAVEPRKRQIQAGGARPLPPLLVWFGTYPSFILHAIQTAVQSLMA
jgi:hypothetical protein